MVRKIFLPSVLAMLSFALATAAQENTIPMPNADESSYDPTLTAKEATLASWDLAVSGIRAGGIVSGNVVELAGSEKGFEALSEQAQFALKTMTTRYSSANWMFGTEAELAPIDPAILQAVIAAAALTCDTGDCAAERASIETAFGEAANAFGDAGHSANALADALEDEGDRFLMTRLLRKMAEYLEGDAWHSDLVFGQLRSAGEEISARIVGVLAIWRYIEPYVGTTSPEIDDDINAAIDLLLRDLRRNTRSKAELAPESREIAALAAATAALATELRRAAALFES